MNKKMMNLHLLLGLIAVSLLFLFLTIFKKPAETPPQQETIKSEPKQIEVVKPDYSKKYAPVLDKYKNFVKDYYDGKIKDEDISLEKPDDDAWDALFQTLEHGDTSELTGCGYAFKQLNGNSSPCLLLIVKYGDGDDYYSVFAIYSLVDGKPKFLKSFSYRSGCNIGADGFLYQNYANSAASHGYEKCKIKSDGTDIETVEKIQSDYPKYYKYKGGTDERFEITEEEYNRLMHEMLKYNEAGNHAGLEFFDITKN